MESLLIVARLFLMLATFVFPQLLGLLLYFRLSRFPKWLAHAVGILAPAALFFYLAPLFFFSGFREAQMRGETFNCGMAAAAATALFLLGTAAELFVGLIVQGYMFRRRGV
jgi:hypothetical protein